MSASLACYPDLPSAQRPARTPERPVIITTQFSRSRRALRTASVGQMLLLPSGGFSVSAVTCPSRL
jgi:hypothetical protein